MSDIETLIELWDMPNGSDELSRDARAELTALRAAAAERDEQKQRADILEHACENALNARDELKRTVEAQAAQLKQAGKALLLFANIPCLETFDDDQSFETTVLAGEIRQCRAWLSANVPAPEEERTATEHVSAFAAVDKLMTERPDLFGDMGDAK